MTVYHYSNNVVYSIKKVEFLIVIKSPSSYNDEISQSREE